MLRGQINSIGYLTHGRRNHERTDMVSAELSDSLFNSNIEAVLSYMKRNSRPVDMAQTLALAVDLNKIEMVPFILEAGADVNSTHYGLTPLMRCASQGLKEMMVILLSRGANINQKTTLFGFTALMYAVKSRHAHLALVLVKSGADVNAEDVKGRTALHYATIYERTEIIQMLLDNGASTDVQDKNG